MAVKDYIRERFFPHMWCPGCGHGVVLNALLRALENLGMSKNEIVMVSGIGCSARITGYVDFHTLHTLHGRALAFATGIKMSRPELNLIVPMGDGDALAIGGNHFIHILRRNINVNILLFNNKIYGLTKGQYSPTTPMGSLTKTSPDGTIENPFNPGELSMGAQGSFFARVVDTEPKMMKEVMIKASEHRGTSMIEVLQNCIIFANQIHNEITGKEVRKEHQIYLKHGEPMLYGTESNKGLVLEKGRLKSVTLGENGITLDDILIHDVKDPDDTVHYMLTRMSLPDLPVAMGVIRSCECPVYESMLFDQVEYARKETSIKTVNELLRSGNTFQVD